MNNIVSLFLTLSLLLVITSLSGCTITTKNEPTEPYATAPSTTETSATDPKEIKLTRYAIWNKKDPIITPIGEVLTAEQWIERYPVAGLENTIVICAAGEINGAIFSTLQQMIDMYSIQGCDFSACKTPEEKLAAIEAFENAMRG